ncbi:MAG: RHS repeat protein, partial [Clostridia bacterium]|nr:RHS repeat protein [Clostridia bacterium]
MEQKVKTSMKLFAFIMALLMLLVSLPISAFASAINDALSDESNVSNNSDSEMPSTKKDVIVLTEDEALRDENIKHFKLSDGTTKAVVYSQAVHYKDAEGKWVDIDNALTLNGTEYYTNNKSKIKFANKSGANGLVNIKDGEYIIDFTPLNTNKVGVVIENPQENNSRKFEDISALNNLVSKAIYADIYNGIDIEYVLAGNNIKENIIVKEKQDSYTFSFELKLNKLSAELVNGAIILSDYDTGEKVYEIPAPYMFDANNEYSESVEYTLTQSSKWKYTFTVTAEAEWINAEEREFPVTIDPTIDVDKDYITDYTYNSSTTETTIKIGNGNKAYIELNTLPYLPKDSYVTSALLCLYAETAGSNYIGAYENETTTLEDYNQISTIDEWYFWDISIPLYNWYDNGATSGKIRLETISGTSESKFYSMENSFGGHPSVVISYRDMKGAESYWSYVSQNVGVAGTGSVNLKTGNLMFAIPTLSATDSLFGFTPTLIYNAAIAGESYTNGNTQNANPMPCMPYGFMLNTQETILKKTYLNEELENETYYVWADADGTEHCFFQSDVTGEENIYYDEDGLQCKLIVNNSSAMAACTLIDSSFNERTFLFMDYGMWYLSRITDKNGNELSFGLTFSNNYPKPSSIKVKPNGSSAIEMLTFAYYSSGMPSLVYNPSIGKAVLLKYSSTTDGTVGKTGSYLREIQHIHCDIGTTLLELEGYANGTNTSLNVVVDATATYEYDSNGKLIKAADNLSNYSIEYTINYFSGMINAVKEYGKNQTQGQSVSINYYRGYTEVKTSGKDDVLETSDDLINVYTFDNYGRAISTYSTDSTRTEIYGAVTGEYEAEVEKAKNSLAMSTVINGNSANYLLNGNFEASDSSVPNWTVIGDTYLSGTSSGIAWDNAKLYMYATPSGTTSISQTVKLSKGTYTMSLNINAYASSNLQIFLKAISSNNTFIEEIPVNEVYASGSGGFASFTFEVNETTATNYTVGIYLVANSSAAESDGISVDNIMLAKTTGMSQYNYVNYADLENYAIGSTLGKWNLTTGAAINNLAYTTIGNSIAITGSISEERSATQTIYTASQAAIDRFTNDMTFGSGATSEEVIFTISGFGKGLYAMHTDKSKFAIVLDITYRTTSSQFTTESIYAEFQSEARGWQFASNTFVLPANSFIKEITVRCEYSNNINIAYFDNITLTCDKNGDTTRYIYNEDSGKLEAELNGLSGGTYYKYNTNGDVSDVVSKRSRVSYTYDENHNLIQTKNYYHTFHPIGELNIDDLIAYCDEHQVLKSTSTYTYDSYGLTATELTYDATNTQYINTRYSYDTSASSKMFGALKLVINSLGNTTEYFYDSDTCQLISVIESDDTGYYYTYDSIGNLIMVQPATVGTTAEPVTNSAEVEFVYNSNNQLESIVANGTTYVFAYDEFGNQESVSIGDNQIVSQETNAYNGKVTKVTYANGTTVEYTYDHLNRVTEIKYTNGTNTKVYNYEYDSNGNLCKSIDSQNGTTTIYKYDASGRLVKMIEYDTEELKNNFGVSYHYDEESRLQAVYYYNDYLFNSTSYANLNNFYYFAYNSDNSLKYINVSVGNTEEYRISYTYDDFSRYANKVIDFGNIDNTTTYSYLSSSNATSALISQYTTSVATDAGTLASQTFNYTYDEANQNITEIKDAYGNVLYRYVYDNLDRLVREDNSVTNKTYLYTYDNNGNITGETVLLYTLGDAYNSTFVESNLWTYANSQWRDQLTNYNGGNIYYDSMGNPIRYYNGLEFTWDNVNNLASISDGWLINTYTYNDSGIRTSKTVNGVTHTYHLDGTKILSEEYGNKLILYIYDEAGSIIGMAYRTSSYASGVFDYYLFTKNLQGDILSIYDANGSCVASYTYNAWGECTVTNHTSANIGNLNPFRYRGYYYDTETGFYYLNARYYDPQIKRF